MKIYIAGPVTGVEDYKEKFKKKEEELRKLGHTPMHSADLPKGFEHKEYMHICYGMIDVCEGVYFMDGWHQSIGATLERSYALKKKKIMLCNTKKTVEQLFAEYTKKTVEQLFAEC